MLRRLRKLLLEPALLLLDGHDEEAPVDGWNGLQREDEIDTNL